MGLRKLPKEAARCIDNEGVHIKSDRLLTRSQDPLRRVVGKLRAIAQVQFLPDAVAVGLDLDSIPQKLVTTRADGNVDYFNPQWMG